MSTDEARRRLDQTDEAFAFHIGEAELRERFVEPWIAREEIVCQGLTFGPERTRIEILENRMYSSVPFTGRVDWDRLRAERKTREVTDRFLTHRATSAETRRNAVPEHGQVEEGDIRDVFISHASEDKASVARPLRDALEVAGHTVWFDEAELVLGDSLSRKIDEGLAKSRLGVVILSRAFFSKNWPQRELQGLVAKEVAGDEQLILPVWHGIDQEFLVGTAPTLADRLAVTTDDGIGPVADSVSRAIHQRRRLEEGGAQPVPAQVEANAAADASEREAQSHAARRDEIVELLRSNDNVGIREFLRDERRFWENGIVGALTDAADTLDRHIDRGRLAALESVLWSLIERRSATLLPLAEYASERFAEECGALASFVDHRIPTRSTLDMWRQSARVPIWLLVHLVGACVTAENDWTSVRALWTTHTADGLPLGALDPAPAERLAEELPRARPNTALSTAAAPLWHLAFRVAGSTFLVERYSELIRAPGIDDWVLACLSRVGDFSWLMTALGATDGIEVSQWWRANQVDPTLPARLQSNGALGDSIGSALFGIDSRDLPSDPNEWVAHASGRDTWD